MARPSQPILSRELIAAAALELIDRTGRFTLPGLAERLSVSVSSLYHHVSGRADIVEGIRGRMTATLTLPDGVDWPEAVRQWATAYRDSFAAHPAAIPILVSQTILDPITLARYDELADVLHAQAGLEGEELVVAIIMIDSLCLGSALDLGAPPEVWAGEGRATVLARATSDTTHRASSELAFERQLGLVIDDLTHRARDQRPA